MSTITIALERISVNLKREQIKNIFYQLKLEEVIDIIKDYQRKSWIKELDELRGDLQRWAKRKKVTDRYIDQMVEGVRKTHYEQNQGSNRH